MFSDESSTKQRNIQSVDTIMIEIMKPATFLANTESIVLYSGERWTNSLEMKIFLSTTKKYVGGSKQSCFQSLSG